MEPLHNHIVVIFENVHFVLLAERCLKASDVDHALIPVPRGLSSNCGVCIEISATRVQQGLSALREQQCPWRQLYRAVGRGRFVPLAEGAVE